MSAGLQIWDASGNLVLDASHRVARIIGSRDLNGAGDSLQDDRLKTGGWVSFQGDQYIGYGSGGIIKPQFVINTATGVLSWSYAAMNNTTYDTYQKGTMFFGAY